MAASKSTAIDPRDVAKLAPSDRPFERRIAGNPGLLIRVQPTGKMTWYFEHARHKRTKLGAYPQHTFGYARAESVRVIERLAAGDEARPEHLRPVAATETPPTLREVFERYKIWYTKRRALDGYTGTGIDPLGAVLTDLGDEPITLTQDRIDRWRRKATVNPVTTNRRVGALRSMFNWLVAEGIAAVNPCVGLKPLPRRKNVDRRIRILSADEEKRLRKALAGKPLEPLWLLAVNTGLRRGELFRLKWTDITGDVIHVARSKSGKSRDVPLNAEARAALAMCKKRTTLVFPGIGGKQKDNIKKTWQTIRTAAKLPHTWHEVTRHTFVSRLLAKGANVWAVGRIVGHASEEMTEHYGHLLQDDARAVTALLDKGAP